MEIMHIAVLCFFKAQKFGGAIKSAGGIMRFFALYYLLYNSECQKRHNKSC